MINYAQQCSSVFNNAQQCSTIFSNVQLSSTTFNYLGVDLSAEKASGREEPRSGNEFAASFAVPLRCNCTSILDVLLIR